MDNEKFQELVLKKLDDIEKTVNLLIDIKKTTQRFSNNTTTPKPSWEPYFDLEAMDKYCRENKIHPGDLTGEEMALFRLRERQSRKGSDSNDQ